MGVVLGTKWKLLVVKGHLDLRETSFCKVVPLLYLEEQHI